MGTPGSMTEDALIALMGAGVLLGIIAMTSGVLISRRSRRPPEDRSRLAFWITFTVAIVGGVAIALISSAVR
jgi:hypothetical protein